jgi:hypothetical protein
VSRTFACRVLCILLPLLIPTLVLLSIIEYKRVNLKCNMEAQVIAFSCHRGIKTWKSSK